MGSNVMSSRHVLIGALYVLTAMAALSWAETTVATTTADPTLECQRHNGSCKDCVSDSACYYCYRTDECDRYPYDTLKPYAKCGDLKDMAWKTCIVSFKTLVITLASVGSALLIVSVCLCCCLCKKCRTASLQRQLDRWDRQRMDMKARHDERRNEREVRRKELRDKYGIGSSNPYSKF